MSVLLAPIADRDSRDAACIQFMKTLTFLKKKSSGTQKSDEPCFPGRSNCDLFRLIEVKLCSQHEQQRESE